MGGRVISEYTNEGVWTRSYVYAGTERIGQQTRFGTEAVSDWRYKDPVTGDEGGSVLDPRGVNVGLSDPFPPNGGGDPDGLVNGADPVKNGSVSPIAMEGGGAQCVIDGISMDCSFVGEGSAQCPDNDCGPRMGEDGKLTQPYRAYPDGRGGFLPEGARYLGNGIYMTLPDETFGMLEETQNPWKGVKGGAEAAKGPCKGSIPEGIARKILEVASREKIDPTLLSVTMRHESSFGQNMKPNPREQGKGSKRKIVGYDVGPMQLATNIWNKSPFTDGLSNPFGTIGFNIAKKEYDSFNGDFEENMTVAARAYALDILPRSKGKDPFHRNADAAGTYRGPADYQGRYDQYVAEAPGDARQLNCIAGRK